MNYYKNEKTFVAAAKAATTKKGGIEYGLPHVQYGFIDGNVYQARVHTDCYAYTNDCKNYVVYIEKLHRVRDNSGADVYVDDNGYIAFYA